MATIRLYRVEDEQIKVNKTKTQIGNDLTGTIKERCNVTDPVITIQFNDNTHGNLIENGCNYCFIEEFGRYYFIENITIVQSKIYQLICHVDVLQSFSTEIGKLNAVISRAEDTKAINTYLNDDKYICSTDPYISTIPFKDGNGHSFKFGGTGNYSWILSIAGGTKDPV